MPRPKLTRGGIRFPGGQIQTETAIQSIVQMVGTESGRFYSIPPSGMFKVVNLYVDTEGKLVVKWENTPEP